MDNMGVLEVHPWVFTVIMFVIHTLPSLITAAAYIVMIYVMSNSVTIFV